MSQILTLTDISYCYPGAPEPLFEHLSATFAAGWAAVLGDNGIGKTTLAKLACGMLSPIRGQSRRTVQDGSRLLSATY
ncbi:ABC transporter ATP-binding protein [Bifidobacterium bifidum]|nr:ABC transporter ATP-binding protein [Bifidobacterium bifidum]